MFALGPLVPEIDGSWFHGQLRSLTINIYFPIPNLQLSKVLICDCSFASIPLVGLFATNLSCANLRRRIILHIDDS